MEYKNQINHTHMTLCLTGISCCAITIIIIIIIITTITTTTIELQAYLPVVYLDQHIQ